jgi:hypothetical protein
MSSMLDGVETAVPGDQYCRVRRNEG